MPDPETVSEAIEESAIDNVRRVSTGNVSIEGHSLRDQIEADKYLNAKDPDAAATPHFGMRFSKMIPGGGGG